MRINLKVIEEKLQAFFEEQLHFFSDYNPFIQLSRNLLESLETRISTTDEQNIVQKIFNQRSGGV